MSSIINNNIISVINPITQKSVGELQCSSQEEVNKIISNANQFSDWRLLSLNKRCSLINKFRRVILKNQNELKGIIKKETGKKDFDILIELFSLLEHLKEISKIAKKHLKPSRRNAGLMKTKKAYVVYEPKGTAGVIAPWNYPLATPITSSVEALLAGNSVVLKPSEHTPLTSLYIKKLWNNHIGFDNAFNIILGGGDVGNILVESNIINR